MIIYDDQSEDKNNEFLMEIALSSENALFIRHTLTVDSMLFRHFTLLKKLLVNSNEMEKEEHP